MKTSTTFYRTLMAMTIVATLLISADAFGQDYCHSCGTDNSCNGSGGSGDCSFAAGESAESAATNSICIGYKSVTNAGSSLSFGNLLSTDSNEDDNMVIGFGDSPSSLLTNDISNSIMIGVNSAKPTMFIEDAGGGSGLGRVGIGTTGPLGLLHLAEEGSDHTKLIIDKAAQAEGCLQFHSEYGSTPIASMVLTALEELVIEQHQSNKDIIFEVNDDGTTDEEVMRIDASEQRVGIGTTAPQGKLHVSNEVPFVGEILVELTVDDAVDDYLRLRNLTSDDDDFAAMIQAHSESQTISPALTIQATTDASGDTGTDYMMEFNARRLPSAAIQTRPLFAWSNGIGGVRMMIDTDGSVGIGTTSPSGKLEVAGTTYINTLPVAGGTPIGYDANNRLVDISGSSQHFKEQIEELEFDQEQFLSMRPVSFNWKAACGGGEDVGFIAQEVAQDFPALADIRYKHTYLADGLVLRDTLGLPVLDSTQTEPYGVKYHKLPVYLYMLAKQQDSTITELTNRVDELQAMVEGCCAQPAYRMSDEVPTETQQSTKSIKNEFVLLQNDPNPFADYTDIRVSVPESANNVSLLIVDMKGSVMLNTPVNGISETIRVYSSDIGKGIFTYYLLSEGNVIASRKMVSSK